MLAENPASELLTALQQDARASARKLAESYQKRQAKRLAEEARLQAMYQYEEQAASQGYRAVAGVDEAGRGPLAGPVSVAAVILPAQNTTTVRRLRPRRSKRQASVTHRYHTM